MNLKLSRREFLKGAAVAGVGVALPLKFGVRESHAFYQSPGLNKFSQTLRGGNAVSLVTEIGVAAPDVSPAQVTGVTHYTIGIQQFEDQLYPAGGPINFGPTKLWGFAPERYFLAAPPSKRHLGGIIVAQRGVPVQITFKNQLTSNLKPGGTPLRSIIPVDSTLPGANQAQNRTAVHIHGGLVPWISDGGPFDWWAANGTHGLSFLNNQALRTGPVAANEAEYYYPNDQSARLVWYHDHAFGITRTNAYAGIATAYVIRDVFEAGLVHLMSGSDNVGIPDFIENLGREIPIVIQDKIFVGSNINAADPTWVQKGLPSTVGSLWYPHVYEKNRWRLLGAGRNLPNPSVIAEMFGDTMLVNGTVYPEVEVEARRYRLRILNACNARFLNLQLYVADNSLMVNGSNAGITLDAPLGNPTNDPGPDWLVIGTEAGFLKSPVNVPSNIPFNIPTADPLGYAGSLITGLAERWDVIVDFKGFENQNIILYTDAPPPFPFGDPRNDYFSGTGSGPDTRVIMRFKVGPTVAPAEPALGINTSTDLTPGIDPFLATPTQSPVVLYNPLVPVTRIRQLTLNEDFDAYGRLIQLVGTTVPFNGKLGRPYASGPITETPAKDDVEIWEIYNLTGDTHPMHFHLVNVQVLQRAQFDTITPTFVPTPNTERPPDPKELGWKETVKMNPGEVTTVIMKFKLPPVPFVVPFSTRTKVSAQDNEYVWHCHILEHEEHDMMRPLVVTGVNPTFGVTPEREAVVGSVGGTVTYTIFGGNPPYLINPIGAAPAPSTLNVSNSMGTFQVQVAAGTPAGSYTYDITDSGTNATTATLVVAPL